MVILSQLNTKGYNMKKVSITLVVASLLAGALYANGNHMGDHMHNGKMMNHANANDMTDMKKMHQECLAQLKNNTPKSNISKVQQEQLNLLSTDNTDLYTG